MCTIKAYSKPYLDNADDEDVDDDNNYAWLAVVVSQNVYSGGKVEDCSGL